MKIRLNKFLSLCGIAARRKSEEYIQSGRVKINEQTELKPQTIINTEIDTVYFDSIPIKPQKFKYYKMNKPRLCLTTMASDERKRTVQEFLPKDDVKLFPVGRLDYDTEGLLIFTNDGDFAHKISHPSFEIKKTYLTHLDGDISDGLLIKMSKGAKLSDGFLLPENLEVLSRNNKETLVKITIHEGRNHIVKNFFKYFNKKVKKLKRIAVGSIKLGELESGKIVELDYNELKSLKKNY